MSNSTLPHSDSESLHHQVLVSGTIGLSITGALTIVRLTIRLLTRARLLWDDAFALLALLILIITAASGKLYYSIDATSTIPQASRVALYCIFAVTFDLTIWTSRLSIISTTIYFGFYTRYLKAMAGLFGAAATILVAQVFWVCEPQNRRNHWKEAQNPQCILGSSVGITQVTTDAFADVVLVVSPLLILRRLKSEEARAHRMRLTVSFAVGGLTTVVSIVHAYYLLKGSQTSLIISNVELSVSVIICNFMVLAAAMHRLLARYRSAPPRHRSPVIATSMVFEAGAVSENSRSEVELKTNTTSYAMAHSSAEPGDSQLEEAMETRHFPKNS
ncbi:hypothetical protein FPV67DRAFT_1508819 [Lyophyllum atratum]|nr:hypothetical protein FPV67DRAFT_1508819 [Lyophyllum atratum]